MRDVITTPRLSGRRVTADDLPYVVATDSDPTIQVPIFGRTFSMEESRERLERWLDIERTTRLGFYIFSDGTEEIGHGGVFPSRNVPGEYEVGYALIPTFWNRGYATEITEALLDAAFDDHGFDRIIGVCSTNNHASRRVLEKAGLAFEYAFMTERWGEGVRYAIMRDDWNRRSSA